MKLRLHTVNDGGAWNTFHLTDEEVETLRECRGAAALEYMPMMDELLQFRLIWQVKGDSHVFLTALGEKLLRSIDYRKQQTDAVREAAEEAERAVSAGVRGKNEPAPPAAETETNVTRCFCCGRKECVCGRKGCDGCFAWLTPLAAKTEMVPEPLDDEEDVALVRPDAEEVDRRMQVRHVIEDVYEITLHGLDGKETRIEFELRVVAVAEKMATCSRFKTYMHYGPPSLICALIQCGFADALKSLNAWVEKPKEPEAAEVSPKGEKEEAEDLRRRTGIRRAE